MASLSFAGNIEVSGNTGSIDVEIGGNAVAELIDAQGAITISGNTSPYITTYVVNNPDGISIDVDGSTPEGTQESITISDGTTTLYLDITAVASDPGGGGSSTIYKMELEDDRLTFSAKGNTNDSRSVGYKIYSSGDGGGNWIECSDPSGVTVTGGNAGYVTVSADNQSLGGWHGHIIVTRTNTDYTNDEIDGGDSVSIQSNTWAGASAEIDITITKVEYNYKLQIDSYPTPSAYNSTITTNNFKVYKYKNSTLNSTYQKESNTDYAGSCTWTPSLPYTGSNTNGESKTFQASLTGSGYDPDSVTIVFPAKAEDPYITLDGESSYEESLNRIGNGEGESTNASLSVATNLSSWGVNASTNASTVSSYGITVQKSGSSVTVNGTSTYGGQNGSSITGIWTVGNSSTYATIEITLTYENEQPVTTYTYRMTLTPSSLTYNNDDFSSRRVYFDIERKANGTSNWIPYDTDSVTATAPSGFSVSVDNQSLSGHHGYADITRTYNGTSLYETSISFDTGGDNPASEELNITVNAQEQVNYDERWVYDGNPSFTEYTYNCSSSQDSHTVGSISGSYTIKKQLAPAGTNNWTDTSPLVTDTKSFSNGSLTTSFTAYRSDATGTPLTVSTSKTATVTDPSVGSAATGSVDIVITFDDPNVDYEYKVEISLDTGYGSLTVSPGTTITPSWFNVLWYKREVGTSSWGNSIINRYDYATYVPDLNYTVPSNAQNGSTFDIEISDNYYSPLAQGYENNETITFTVYVAPLEYNLVCTNPSTSSITLPYGSSVSKSDFTFKLTYGGSDVETGISGNSNSLSWSGNGPSLPWTNNYSYSGSHNYSVTYNTYSASTTVTIFFEPEDTPPPQDTYTLECTTNPYNSSTNGLTNGSSLDKSGFRFTLKKNGSVEQNNIAGNSNVLSWNPSSWTNNESSPGTKSFTVTHTSHNEASTSVTIYYKAPVPPASSTVTFDDETGTISAGSTKYFYVSFTPKGSNSGSGVNYSLSSTSYATINSSWQGLTTGRGYVVIKNNSRTIQERTVTLTATHKLNSSVSDTVEITLLPPSFVVEFEYWYDAPCAYGEIGSGELTVRGAVGEQFTLTITNNSTSNGFTYGFRNGNSYSTTYSGTIGSSGYTTVDVYEYTKGENAEDSYSTSKITGVGGNSSRTDYCMVARRKISASMSMNANPYSFPYTGGNCTFSLSSSGFNDPSFELIEYSDGAAMIENSASYIGRITDYPGTFSVRITENTAVTSRRVTVRFRVRGTEYSNDYESEFVKEVTLTQAGRAPEQVIIVNPSSLTFAPTANGTSVAQMVTISSGDYEWNIVGNLPDWLAIVNNKTSGVSGDTISIYPTSQSGVNTRSAAITFQATGGTITGSLTILQTENERLLGFGHADDSVSKGWDIADEDFTGLSKYNDEHGWSYNASTRTLTINIPAESPKTLGTSQTETVNALYKVISRFIGWDMKVEGEAPTWLRVSPTSKFYDPTKTNTESTNINVVADDYNFQIDSSCYDQPRTAKYIINSNLKKNQ